MLFTQKREIKQVMPLDSYPLDMRLSFIVLAVFKGAVCRTQQHLAEQKAGMEYNINKEVKISVKPP